MTTEELIDYYVSLLIIQYATQPNAMAMITALCAGLISDQIISQIGGAFNFAVDPIGLQPGSAAGVQLDAVASYRGAQRSIYGVNVNRTYFEMPFYGESGADEAPGFALYGQSPILDLWLTYTDAVQPLYALTDDELYRLTQLRARTQGGLLSVENVDDILFDFFGDNVSVFEDSPMKITYIDLLSDTDTLFTIAAATGSLPRPAGVQATYLRSDMIDNFFGLQFYGEPINTDFVGFGLYGSPQTGSFVRYP